MRNKLWGKFCHFAEKKGVWICTMPSATTHGLYPIVLFARHRRLHRPRWGTAGHEEEPGKKLSASPFGAAGCRPNRGCRPRVAAEAAWHIVTKPHLLQTYRDAGSEWASGAARRSMCQAGASASRCSWSGTRKESRAACGQEEQVQSRGTNHADVGHGRADSFTLNSNRRS